MLTDSSTRDGDLGVAAAEVTFGGDDLVVVVRAQVHAVLPPSVEVARRADGAANVASGILLGVADGPELLEGLSTVDRGLVVASGLEDIVVGSIAVDGTLPLGSGRGVVGAVGLDDVVLDQGVASPAVHSEVAVSVGVVVALVVDVTSQMLASALDRHRRAYRPL